MIVAPAPIVPLYIAVGTIPVAVPFVPFLFEPVAVGPILALIPLVVIATVSVVVPLRMIVLGDCGERGRKGRGKDKGTDKTTHWNFSLQLKKGAIAAPQ